MDQIISELLISSMQELDDSSSEFITALKFFLSDFEQKNYKDEFYRSSDIKAQKEKDLKRRIERFEEQMNVFSNQIFTHMNLDKTDLTSVNFYEEFNSFFDSNMFEKKVEYYVQQGFGNKPELITDPKILKKEFIIPSCFHSMKLVPENIASNARKYSPKGGIITVSLINEDTYKYITVVNEGPYEKELNLTQLTDDYRRGENAGVIAGMGLGTSQVKTIVLMHKSMLDTTFSMKSSDDIILFNGVPHSVFTTKISYNTVAERSDLDVIADEFRTRIPLIILHNMGEITANMLQALKTLSKFHFNRFSRREFKWTLLIARQIANINRMQNIMKTCLFARNNYSTDYLWGNVCDVLLYQSITNNLRVLNNYEYQEKDIKLSIYGNILPISSYSVLYPVIFGICDLVLNSLHDSSSLHVDMDEENYQVSFRSEHNDFLEYINLNKPKQFTTKKEITVIQLLLYKKIFEELEMEFRIESHEIILTF